MHNYLCNKGALSTVEGFISTAVENLENVQKELKEKDPENAVKIGIFLGKLKRLLSLEDAPFSFQLDDPTGNSFIAGSLLLPGQVDPNLSVCNYKRTAAQDEEFGISTIPAAAGEASAGTDENLHGDVVQFSSVCPRCDKPDCEANMKQLDIPNFGEVVVMATYCPSCGFREAEARPGGGVADLGRKITVAVKSVADLKRMIVKSSTAAVMIPEVELELTAGTLGGRITTVEGLIQAVIDDLEGVIAGDSVADERRQKIDSFIKQLTDLATGGRFDYRMVIDDPAGKIYVEALSENDSGLTIEDYERSFEQREELGLNDMKTEGYEDIIEEKEEEQQA